MVEIEDDIGLRFHYLFDGTTNRYLVGARLIGNTKPIKEILDNKEVELRLESRVEEGPMPWFDMGRTCFISTGVPNVYHTEKLFEIKHEPTESDNPFSNLNATLYSRNAMIACFTLSDVIEK